MDEKDARSFNIFMKGSRMLIDQAVFNKFGRDIKTIIIKNIKKSIGNILIDNPIKNMWVHPSNDGYFLLSVLKNNEMIFMITDFDLNIKYGYHSKSMIKMNSMNDILNKIEVISRVLFTQVH